jgi:hypothetical protein
MFLFPLPSIFIFSLERKIGSHFPKKFFALKKYLNSSGNTIRNFYLTAKMEILVGKESHMGGKRMFQKYLTVFGLIFFVQANSTLKTWAN